jgi:peroxiredoxin Q/BCP
MMYGKKVMGVVRTTYLINEEGIIVEAIDKMKAKDNPDQMLAML